MTVTILTAEQARVRRTFHRCACRAGCLAVLRRDDDVTATGAGTSLTAHVAVVAYLAAVDEDVAP